MTAKFVIGVICLCMVQLCTQAESSCHAAPPSSISNLQWPDMDDLCLTKVKDHVKNELQAAITYLAMGAHFLDAAHFRPGVAKMVLKHASEERQHAMALIDYLLMRGYNITKETIPTIKPVTTTWNGVFDALSTTLEIEKTVRDNFKEIILQCETGTAPDNQNDYHISDVLTGTFLAEQHQGVREISEMLSTLARMLKGTHNVAFAEFEFDRTLLAHE